MCNKLHRNHKPIPTEGKGWKVVIEQDGAYKTLCFKEPIPIDTWRIWDATRPTNPNVDLIDTSPIGDGGFCFFLEKQDAEKFLTSLKQGLWYDEPLKVVPVIYKAGLGKQVTDGVSSRANGIPCALAKEMKIDE